MLGLHWHAWAFSSCGIGSYSLRGGYSALSCSRVQAPGAQASEVVAHRLGGPMVCGILPDQGSNPFPALAGGFLTTGLPGKTQRVKLTNHVCNMFCNFRITSLILNMPVYPMKTIKFHCSWDITSICLFSSSGWGIRTDVNMVSPFISSAVLQCWTGVFLWPTLTLCFHLIKGSLDGRISIY